MKELRIEELTTKQKLGIAMTGRITKPLDDPDTQYALDLIRNHSLGAVWLTRTLPNLEEYMAAVKEVADYPILIMTDAESGLDPYTIGRQNAIGCANDEELAYAFGKVTAVTARKKGYNVVCNPILDLNDSNSACGGTVRSIGGDKVRVAELAAAEARGMHDGGVLTVGKHYPGIKEDIDSHMAETSSDLTEEELIDYNLYPYIHLMKEGLLDGIMTQHSRVHNIDPDYPASLSKKVIGIIRDLGFDGFAITDALSMMGISAKFGNRECKGLSIANGNDLALTWGLNQEGYESICEAYDKGVIDDARLDEAVTHVLNAQHKTLLLPTDAEITEQDEKKVELINIKSIFAKVDDGLTPAISREGRHYFVILTDMESTGVDVDTFRGGWYYPAAISKKIKSLFPNSETLFIKEYPSTGEIYCVLGRAVRYEDVVFVTFMESQAYVGYECLTSRVLSTIQALQVTNSVTAVVHFGNPYVLEDMVHIPRILIGGLSSKSVEYTFEVLAGERPAEGSLTYDVKLP